MNRRMWLTSLLAFPFVPWMFRAAQQVPTGFIELIGEGAGGIELIIHEQASTANTTGAVTIKYNPSKDCWWSCHTNDGTRVSFIGSHDIGPAKMKDRIRLAREAKKP